MNPPICFPGTQIPVSPNDLLAGIFTATNGISLSQVCEITGLEPGTVQNWVKRGYVSSPVGRKYSKGQVARIILINMLRETLVIEKAVKLLSYVNGNLVDSSDDIVDDSDIYKCLCNILIAEGNRDTVSLNELYAKTEEQLADFKEPYSGAKKRLELAMKTIICAYESARFKKCALQFTELF